jgi:adenosylcobyric acid synthase
MQLLGQAILDPGHLEDGDAAGLGLLDLTTTLVLEKVTRQVEVGWAEGGRLQGYEIHHGQTHAGPRARPYLERGLGFQQDNVWGVYVHGLFENAAFRQRFLERLGWQGQAVDWSAALEAELDRVADLLETSIRTMHTTQE